MESKFSGMTVNERLYAGGFIDDFDYCLKHKDVEGVKSILKKIELNEDSILEIINTLELSK